MLSDPLNRLFGCDIATLAIYGASNAVNPLLNLLGVYRDSSIKFDFLTIPGRAAWEVIERERPYALKLTFVATAVVDKTFTYPTFSQLYFASTIGFGPYYLWIKPWSTAAGFTCKVMMTEFEDVYGDPMTTYGKFVADELPVYGGTIGP